MEREGEKGREKNMVLNLLRHHHCDRRENEREREKNQGEKREGEKRGEVAIFRKKIMNL